MFINSGLQSLQLVFNSDTASMSSVSVLFGSSVSVLPANSGRKGCLFYNSDPHGNAVYLAYSNTASSTSITYTVPGLTTVAMDLPVYTGVISATSSKGGPTVILYVTELT